MPERKHSFVQEVLSYGVYTTDIQTLMLLTEKCDRYNHSQTQSLSVLLGDVCLDKSAAGHPRDWI